jgi:hypothetical protein
MDWLALLFCSSELVRSSVLLAVVIGTLVMELGRRRSCGASWQQECWAVGVNAKSIVGQYTTSARVHFFITSMPRSLAAPS